MQDIQEGLMRDTMGGVKTLFSFAFKAANFIEGFGAGIKDFLNKNTKNPEQTVDQPKHGKMALDELLLQNRGANTMTVDDLEEWDNVAAKYGVDYAIQEEPVFEKDNKTPKCDYKECTFEKDANGETLMDYSRCNVSKDENGYEKFDDKGKPILEPDSLDPVPVLAEGSKEPTPLKNYTVYFKAQDTDVITKAFKEYVENDGINKDLQNGRDKINRANINNRTDALKSIDEIESKIKDKLKQKGLPFNKAFEERFTKLKDKVNNLPERFDVSSYKKDIVPALEQLIKECKKGLGVKKDQDKNKEPKINIKNMIKINKEKAANLNKDNPEKHHNRGEQSL